jgi:hypothetical protein
MHTMAYISTRPLFILLSYESFMSHFNQIGRLYRSYHGQKDEESRISPPARPLGTLSPTQAAT